MRLVDSFRTVAVTVIAALAVAGAAAAITLAFQGGGANSSARSRISGGKQESRLPSTPVLLGLGSKQSHLAEGVGFEPTEPLRARLISSQVR